MTPVVLVDELINFIKPVVANFELQTNIRDIKKAPQVVGGYLKEKKPGEKQDPPDFPFVIVRFMKKINDIATVRIICGAYSEDHQGGWRDSLNIADRIEQALLKQPYIKAFKVESVETELPEEQPYPEWAAFLNVTVTMPTIVQEEVIL